MAQNWPGFVLVETDDRRRHLWEACARATGVAMRSIPAIPGGPDEERAGVRLLVVHPSEPVGPLLRKARFAFPLARVIVCESDGSQAAAVDAFRAGADDFISIESDESERASLLARHLAAVAETSAESQEHGGLIGESGTMRDLRGFIRRLAPSSVTVLITGETGTGKDCAALLLHRLSRRATGPLVALNCAAIPEALLEGELFGYERGAFSGALSAYPGKLKLADGGTLFLDEIGELSLAGQAKVLRAIETREVYRLGARTPTRFDVRIVAATNRDLAAEMEAGRFREDLFYRLAVARVPMPPLRERPEDIAPITRHLLQDLAASAGQETPRLDDAAAAALEAYRWPGNVRELRNALEVAMVSADAGRIRARDLPASITGAGAPSAPKPADERAHLLEALARAGGNKSLAAQALNCSRMTLYRKLARYGLVDDAEAADTVTVTQGREVSPSLSQTL
ncbi:MAG: sigma-54 dependent transcriptional regulator [Acetobacteraceae bacterium]